MKATNENIRLLKPLFRGLPIIIAVSVLAVMAVKRYLKYATPQYESTAKIRLADTKDGSPSANLYKDFDVFTTANKIIAEVEVLKSKLLIKKVIDSLGMKITTYRVGQIRKVELYNQSPFKVQTSLQDNRWYDKTFALTIKADNQYELKLPGESKTLNGMLGTVLHIEGADLLINRNDNLLQMKPNMTLADHYEFIINSEQKQTDEAIANFDIIPIDKETPVIRINYKSPVPQKAADMVNMLAKAYVEDYIATKCKAANTTVNFLNQQLNEVGNKLAASENEIENFRDQKNIINIRQETETDLRKIADMKVQQTNVRMNLEAIEKLDDYMKAGNNRPLDLAPNFEAYTDLLSTELVKKMKLLQGEKKDLLTKYTPEHESVKVIDEKLNDITGYLREGISNTRKNLETKYGRISTDINESEKVFIGLPTKEKTLGILNRNFNLNEQTYNFLHEKRTEAEIVKAATISFHRIISVGEVPLKPVSPNGTLLKVLAVFLAMMGSVLLIYIIHATKGKVNDAYTIEKKSSIPVAANTPRLTKTTECNRYFHKLAIQLDIKNLLPQNGILCFSSFATKEGKAFNIWHLAKELAIQNKKVLLFDVDGSLQEQYAVHNILNIQYINMNADMAVYGNTSSLKEQLPAWKNKYDHVIIKNEPLNTGTNSLLLLKLADANLFVLDSRRTPAGMITETELMQEEYKFGNIQFLLNRAGYNPNILTQVINGIQQFFIKNRKIK
jgi:uncharacterized protein involved in exopolysaccharide biosynthesis